MVGASKNIQNIWNLDNLIIALDRRYFSYVDVSRISPHRFSPHPGCFLERRFWCFFCGSGWQKNAFDLIGWTNIRDDCWHHLRNMWVSNPVIVAFQMFGSLLNHDAMEAMLFPYAPWNMYQTCSCHSGNVGQFPSQSMIFYLTVIHSNSVHISTYIIYNCIYNYIYVHNIYIHI